MGFFSSTIGYNLRENGEAQFYLLTEESHLVTPTLKWLRVWARHKKVANVFQQFVPFSDIVKHIDEFTQLYKNKTAGRQFSIIKLHHIKAKIILLDSKVTN